MTDTFCQGRQSVLCQERIGHTERQEQQQGKSGQDRYTDGARLRNGVKNMCLHK